MAHDILFGRTKQNWSREVQTPQSDEVTFKMTDAEMKEISAVALTRAAAEGGDASAKKKLALWVKSLTKVQARANRGDVVARRKMLVLRESGVLRPTQKIDLMGLSLGRRARKRLRRQRRLQDLRSRAAAGDQAAITRLQQISADLGVPASTVAPVVPATPSTPTPGSQTLASLYPGVYSSSTPATPTPAPTYPTAYPSAYPTTYPTYARPQYAYQSPYYDPSLSQNPYGPPTQPTIDVYQGEEEAALAGDGGGAERAALARMRSTSCGADVPNVNYRAAVYRQAIRQAGGKQPSTRDVFLAKSKVDKVMGRAGIGIYLPGARPGRQTI